MLRSHRLLVGLFGVLLILLVAQSAAAAPAPTGMGWTAIDRYGGDRNGDGRFDQPGPFRPANLNDFPVRVLPSTAICDELESAVWRVDGKPAEPLREFGEPCAAVVRVRGEGEHRVKVLARNRAEVARIEIDDELIVALGDSVASGEGNPEKPVSWLDPACHRSAAAGFEQAAHQLGAVDRRRSITFVSLACSGAQIEKGMLEPYAGIAPRKGVFFAPQVDRLGKIAASRRDDGGGSGVDAVLVSIGANNLRFSSVAVECALPFDCRKKAQKALNQRFATLGGSYDDLGERLEQAAPETPILITEYFDPTHDEEGDFCSGPGATSPEEAKFAYRRLLVPLNAEIDAAAARNDWQRVDEIAADFRLHGFCAAKKPWVLGVEDALAQWNPWGTLHPNGDGHQAIARRVARPLAGLLDFLAPAPAPEAEEEDDSLGFGQIAAFVGGVVLAPHALVAGNLLQPDPESTWRRVLALWLLLPLLAGLLWLAMRALMLLRATWPEDPSGTRRAPPQFGAWRRMQLSTRHLLFIAAGLAVLFAAMILLASLVGRAILWLRFWSAKLPADQAVSSVSGGELVSTGGVALAIFIGLGLVAAVLAWLLDAKGREVRTTRRGLVAIGLAEVLALVWIGDFRFDQGREIFVGLVVAALLLHYLVDRVLEWRRRQRRKRPIGSTVPPGREIWSDLKASVAGFAKSDEPWIQRLFQLAPFFLLLVAFYFSFRAEGADRRLLVLVPYLLAAVLFAAPGGLAAHGVKWKRFDPSALLLPRVALAVSGLSLILIILVRDEIWLAGVAATAALLGLVCLAVAAASGDRFAPYGLAVLVSVPLFAGAAAFLHGLDSPELQPVAVVLDDGEAVCGAYVGESDDQLWIGRLVLDERAGAHRPQRGAISPLDADRVEARALGPMEPVDLLEPRALELRDELLEAREEEAPQKRAPTCTPSPGLKRSLAGAGKRSPRTDWRYEIADDFQPELVIDRRDRFWPVPVQTLFSVRDRRAAICRRVAGGDGCLRLGRPGEFPWIGGQGEFLEYPAADNDFNEQHDQMVEALGTADPEASAAEYFLVHQDPETKGPISIQYWFFYPFNYQPAGDDFVPGGFHEGDFEAVGVLLSAKERKPRYVWMNRHDEEGRAFPWSDEALSRPQQHPRVFVARGSHATYENCEGQVRPLEELKGLIDDHPTCDQDNQLHLMPEVTPLIDLSRVGWACWQGLFGHRDDDLGVYERLPSLINDAPKSPLWQQKFGGDEVQPCRGLPDPGGRDGLDEETVEERTRVPGHLRKHASPLERAIDDCSDWEKPATSGIYMVVCSQGVLDLYVDSGLENAGDAGIRLIARDSRDPEGDEVTVPAVRRNRNGVHLDDWRIVASEKTKVTVYASCPSEEGVLTARFTDVMLEPGKDLTLRDQGPGGVWALVKPDGALAWETLPYTTKAKKGILVPRAPKPGKFLPCGNPDG